MLLPPTNDFFSALRSLPCFLEEQNWALSRPIYLTAPLYLCGTQYLIVIEKEDINVLHSKAWVFGEVSYMYLAELRVDVVEWAAS